MVSDASEIGNSGVQCSAAVCLASPTIMTPPEFFHFCPRCGVRQASVPAGNPFLCGSCQLRYFFNPAVAAAVFIRRKSDGRILLIRRAKEPGLGKLAPPGGFIDFGETAEHAVAREVREEVGLELEGIAFLCSQPNAYLYAGLTYRVLDLFFVATASSENVVVDVHEVSGLDWYQPAQFQLDDLAFPSMKAAWQYWRSIPRDPA